MICSTCNGMRFVVVKQPQYQNVTTWVNPDTGLVTSQMLGGVPVRHQLPTGRMSGISEVCSECQGTGLALDPARDPDCPQCHGRGERNAWASSGEWETEPCSCTKPARFNVVEAAFLGRRSM